MNVAVDTIRIEVDCLITSEIARIKRLKQQPHRIMQPNVGASFPTREILGQIFSYFAQIHMQQKPYNIEYMIWALLAIRLWHFVVSIMHCLMSMF